MPLLSIMITSKQHKTWRQKLEQGCPWNKNEIQFHYIATGETGESSMLQRTLLSVVMSTLRVNFLKRIIAAYHLKNGCKSTFAAKEPLLQKNSCCQELLLYFI